MIVLTADCPHCRAHNMTFEVIGWKVGASDPVAQPFAAIAATCRQCGMPIALQYETALGDSWQTLHQRVVNIMQRSGSLNSTELVPVQVWPAPEAARIPDDLPPEVERALGQAEHNFSSLGCEEAAAMMYRRALEIGLKKAYPEMKGMLAARIKQLVAEHHLPAPLGEWLDQVKLIGNEGAHEVDGVSRDDLEAQRGFVDMALRYIFTMPAQIAARRGLPPEVA
ncbi:DUF4145 domain-containing protein [Sphingomonas sp. H39-1-10]|uniref:DUF4145 domain-containing protein n=1 Tax=Sphingomonas pollutisoli TaxID=3030829 RepID=UPI0023B8DC41|nr:DUF4145 domain-containing protein [Sphingomonas pollutisoli]MDF0490682.1 DUF4145 domain-containing protein [Sphingomonas pollutisoli]